MIGADRHRRPDQGDGHDSGGSLVLLLDHGGAVICLNSAPIELDRNLLLENRIHGLQKGSAK
ncbi:hypothetical protein ASG39_21165 [Rhizobium sp. Leaf371]|nr:hypothetical protein ASG39_21165 [Rhizobium sp. Leaf371]